MHYIHALLWRHECHVRFVYTTVLDVNLAPVAPRVLSAFLDCFLCVCDKILIHNHLQSIDLALTAIKHVMVLFFRRRF